MIHANMTISQIGNVETDMLIDLNEGHTLTSVSGLMPYGKCQF